MHALSAMRLMHAVTAFHEADMLITNKGLIGNFRMRGLFGEGGVVASPKAPACGRLYERRPRDGP